MKRKLIVAVAVALLGYAAYAINWSGDHLAWNAGQTDSKAIPSNMATMLDRVKVVDKRPDRPGYDRDCGRGDGCVFGQAWRDTDGNGCDARNDVLRNQMRHDEITLKPRTHGCVVLLGTLDDPYTGQPIAFRKTNPLTVQIDHVYPLAMAWDMGADKWTESKRVEFANDQVRNLLAVSGPENHDKSDKGPAQWLVPHNPAYRCTYASRFLLVALAYDLPVTKADAAALRSAAKSCS